MTLRVNFFFPDSLELLIKHRKSERQNPHRDRFSFSQRKKLFETRNCFDFFSLKPPDSICTLILHRVGDASVLLLQLFFFCAACGFGVL